MTFETSTEVTRLAAAASAVRDALERLEVDEFDFGIVVRIESSTGTARVAERVIADVSRRYGVHVTIDWR